MTIDVGARQPTLSAQVAEEIRVAMTRRRVSGRQLAQALGVSPSWVSYRLSGVQPIDLNDLQRIATALQVPILDLLPAAEVRHRVDAADHLRAPGGVTSADRRPRGYPVSKTRPTAPQRSSLRSVA